MDILGKRLVRSLLSEQDLSKLSEVGVDEHCLFEDARKVLLWSTAFLRDTGKWPTVNQVEENTKVELPDVPDDLTYICNLIRQRSLGKALDGSIKSVLKQLADRDPDEALRLMGEAAVTLKPSATSKARVESFRERGPDRYKEYVDLKHAGLKGVRTPWKDLDEAIYGWIDGTLNVIIATQNTGKSWGCCLIAEGALREGVDVLFITLEMSTRRMERRLDSLHYGIDQSDLLRSEIDLFTELRWENEVATETTGRGDIFIADKNLVRYVGDVASLVAIHKPKIVVIDGGYRFEAKGTRGDWEASKAIVGELQTTAESTDIPWIVTSQQGEVGAKAKLENSERAFKVKYAKEWIINPDNVIEMFQNDDLRLLKQMEWKLLKIRDDPGETIERNFLTEWDTNRIKFDQVDMEKENTAGTAVTY